MGSGDESDSLTLGHSDTNTEETPSSAGGVIKSKKQKLDFVNAPSRRELSIHESDMTDPSISAANTTLSPAVESFGEDFITQSHESKKDLGSLESKQLLSWIDYVTKFKKQLKWGLRAQHEF